MREMWVVELRRTLTDLGWEPLAIFQTEHAAWTWRLSFYKTASAVDEDARVRRVTIQIEATP